MVSKKRITLIGLDGATWDLIRPWADSGKLPTFKFLLSNGVWGFSESTIPPLSPSAWVSIYTGCMPSKHGIFGFVKRKANSYFYRPISSNDVKKPTIWEILSKYGKRSIVINAPFSYPPKRINGVLITGLGTPSLASNFTFPSSYKDFIVNNFPKYDVDFDEELLLVSDKPEDFIRKITDVTLEQKRLTEYFFENEKWDLMFSVFRALDVIQHYFWREKELIFKFYKIFDNLLAALLRRFSEDDVLFVVSDHGFGPVRKYFCVNNWLERIGMLKIRRPAKKSVFTAEKIKKFLLRHGMRDSVWKVKRSFIVEKLLKIIPSEEFNYVFQIVWEKTKAYYYDGSDGIININLKGREPSGSVSSEEYSNIVKYIIRKLKELRDPETGERIVEKVYTKMELYKIDDVALPDIFIQMKDEYKAVAYNKLDGESIFMIPIHGRILRPGDHRKDGIFIFYDVNTLNKQLKTKVKLWDLAPTILNIFGFPREQYMDGCIIES
jgi:predicted AlkP superfamily phosphohydrolase/phosphomutase